MTNSCLVVIRDVAVVLAAMGAAELVSRGIT